MSSQIMRSELRPCGPNRGEELADIEIGVRDARLRADIRLLGRILGDTVRDQEGADVFDLVERIRQTSIRFHRDDDRPARRELEIILDSMSTSETVRIVRAFSYFSHLANIAEDQNNIRQMRRAPPQPGRRARARWRTRCCMRARPASARPIFAPLFRKRPGQPGADRAPDRGSPQEHARPRDGDRRTAGPARTRPATPEESEAGDEQLRRAVLTLWQTNLLRRTKLTVLDEVANGLSFYDYTFLQEVPRMHGVLEDRLNEADAGPCGELGVVLRMGSWIGGDRDGKSFVTAEVMRETLRLQSSRALRLLSRRTACAGRRTVARRPPRRYLGGSARTRRASTDTSPHRSGEAYRLAVIRHLCAADRDCAEAGGRRPPGRRSEQRRPMPMWRSSRPISIFPSFARHRTIQRARARAAAAVAPGRRLFRLSSRQPGHAPEFRGARTHGRGTVRRGDAGRRISEAGRGGAHRAAARRVAHATPAGLALRRIIARRALANLRFSAPPPGFRKRRQRDPAPASFRAQGRRPTCWSSPCC